MGSAAHYLNLSRHIELVDEYNALESGEDRLSWLMEREPQHASVPAELITDDRRVPGCLSGLWLHGGVENNLCYFSAKSESPMVQGIVSFLCDLYSERSPAEVVDIGDSLANVLGLERLLSATRKRAVSSTVSYILSVARSAKI